MKGAVERFNANHVVDVDTGCWVWTAYMLPTGYARFRANGRKMLVHRWAYEHFIAPIPAGLEMDHLCRNRSCVNPHHLEPVTHAENVWRAHGLPECMYGHPFDEKNTYYPPTGGRRCKACQKARGNAYRARRRLARAA